jgi:hypothetical protein
MGTGQWSDLEMYLQKLMLLLKERGIDTCTQGAWSIFNYSVREFMQVPSQFILFCGKSIGCTDPDAPINSLKSKRLTLAQLATMHGFNEYQNPWTRSMS